MMCQGAAWAMWSLLLLCLALIPLSFASNPSAASPEELHFLFDGYNASIRENSRPRTYLGSRRLMGVPLEGLPPSAQLRFSIIDGDSDEFFTSETEEIGGIAVLQIRTRTGMKDVLNRERKAEYRLTVKGEIRNHHKAYSGFVTTTVNVKVLDINDNIPLFYEDSYEVTVGEDAKPHTPLVTVSADDADIGPNGKVYYSLLDPSNNYFSVHPTSGIVSLTRTLDSSRKARHKVIVVAEDRGMKFKNRRKSRASQAVIIVNVLKVNLHSPKLIINHLPQIIEHAHTNIYAIITVKDLDTGRNGEIKSVDIISGDPDKLFNVMEGSKTGEYNLAVLKLLDRELAPIGYNLTIRAVDAGTPARSSVANIHVNIADINDQAPIFLKEQYDEAVSEEAPPYTSVVRVAASDVDEGNNGKVLFRIVAGNEEDKFLINPLTGLISTNDWLDAESAAYYSLAVAAVDQASNAQRKQSSAKVVIRVLDGNDNAPQFSTPNTEVTIDENEPTGSYVTRVVALDADSGENGFVSYSIANLDQVPFTIDPFDGTIKTSSVIDYEAQRRVYTIKVRASDWGQPLKQETETTVKVKIRDVNDNRPVFVGNVCSGWIDLDSSVGSTVTKFEAIDLDADDRVFYRLEDSDLSDCWALDSTSGILAVSCSLRERISRERRRTLVINVTATDGRHISDKASLSLALIDKDKEIDLNRNSARVACEETNILKRKLDNEKSARDNNEAVETFALFPPRYGYNSHSPEFPPKFPDKVDIREDSEIGHIVIKVNATDHDRGHNGRIVYSIASGDTDSVFEIDTFTGYIYVASDLDREKTEKYVLNITVYDLGIPHKVSSRNLTVNILDVNDNAPEFTQLSYSLHLPENTRNGTSVAQLVAEDLDLGQNGLVSYELVTKLKEFTLDPISGVLYVSNYLDREVREEYDLRVRAWDNAIDSPKFSLARVLVTVLDVNDCPPDFGAAREIKISVPEDIPIGAVVATLQAFDKDLGDGGRIKYSFVSGHRSEFRVDSETGIVKVASTLDFETIQFYNISVKAEDQGFPPLSSMATLLVQVTDVDENSGPPEFSKRVIRASVAENEPPGTLVAVVNATDPDGGELIYDIVEGSGKGVFSVTKKGEIRTVRRLDRETKKGYWVTVVVSDRGTVPLTDTCHVYIEVEDVNDRVPQTEAPVYRPTVKEDASVGTTVVILNASDGDLAPSNVTFFISRSRRRRNGWMLSHPEGEEDAQEVFSVNKETGVVTTTAPLDRERQSEYDLWIGVTDGQRTSLTPVFVTVIDVNDNAPKFLEKVYRFNVPSRPKSKTLKRQPIFRVFAMDEDTGRNADIRYSIKTRRGKFRFKIDESTGYIFCSKSLNAGQTFDLTVKATDNGFPQLTSTAHVIIRVVETPSSSPHPPTIDIPPTAHVMETDPVGHVVTFINAFDLDNDSLWYSIDDGNDDYHFSVGLDSGLLILAKELDRETRNLYTLTIGVTDGVHTTKAELKVRVMDFNDHRPTFSRALYETTASESTRVGTTLLTLRCRDQDGLPSPASPSLDLPSSSLFFAVRHSESAESRALFTLDAVSGNLVLAQPLNRELAAWHSLTVSCEDRGGIQREDLARVSIEVKDSNDHSPVFLESTVEAQVSEGASAGSVVARVTAVDEDEGENGRISYSIVEGNEGATFRIDYELGDVILVESLLQKKTREFLLLVRAMDHAHKPKSASLPVRISVKSSPDVPPTWEGASLPRVIELSEWTPINSAVAIVTAAAPPSLMYEIIGGNSGHETFAVSPSSGVLSLRFPLDHEETDFYNLTIKATNAVGLSRTRWLSVRVTDENDWAPVWESLEYEGTVSETAEVGSPVLDSVSIRFPEPLSVKAIDNDSGRNGRVTYSIVERHVTDYFSVDEFTGAVRVVGRLSEIGSEVVELRIWARDSGKPRRECVAPSTVRIYVKKALTSEPMFPKPLYEAYLYLPTVEGVKVTCVSVSDSSTLSLNPGRYFESPFKRPLQPFEYSIAKGNERKQFRIDASDGCIYVSSNRVNMSAVYNLTVNASSLASTNVTIRVRDLPKEALKFSQESYWANVLENTTKELNLLVVRVKGLPLNSHVEYSLLNGNDFFDIRPTSGILRTTGKPFDWEKRDHFSLIVQAREAGIADSFGHVIVKVAVMDVNDNEPVFVGQPYDALVSTSAKRGHVIAKVKAVDADSGKFGEVRYELVRGSGELFRVGKKTGEITLKQTLTEAHKTLSLTVAAYDGGKQPLSSQAHVIIRVVSADGPLFDQPLYKASVPEDKVPGSAVTRVEARSSSGNDVIYTIIAGDSDGYFDLDYETGVIRVASGLDYEWKSSHNLTIRARDPVSGLHSDTHVSVLVEDVNDNPPVFQRVKFLGEVSEAVPVGYTVLKVQAFDRDTGLGGLIRYECSETCGNFTIDSQTGHVILNGALDAESVSSYSFSIIAKDQGLPPLLARATVVINVLDFNDNAPSWPQDAYESRVSTEAKAGHAITTMWATDPDVTNGDGGRLTYHIVSGDSQSLFFIEPNSGLVSITAPHKLVGGSKVSLNVSASDGVHVAFTSLTVRVLSANDFAPRFRKPLYESGVEENAPPGQLVARVEAADADGGEYGEMSYEVLGQEKDRKFSIDSEGNMKTEVPLDREIEPLHVVTVAARDGGGKSGFAKVRVYVKDKNDFAPVFTLPQYQANIPVDAPPDTIVLKVTAEDADEGSNSKVTYELYEDGNADALRLFRIKSDSGELLLNVEIADKENEVFQFFIRATDGGVPPLHNDVPVTIFLISSHERPPFCPRKYAQFFLSEDDPVGTVVTSLWGSEGKGIKYFLISDSDGGAGEASFEDSDGGKSGKEGLAMPFGLSPSSEVVVEGKLDHEFKRVHTVTIINQTLTTPPLVDYMTISIVVMDVNDCTPEFSSPSYDVLVAENSQVGAVITHLSATDKDEGNNGQIQYTFKNTTDVWIRSVVSIDPHTGAVTLTSPLDREMNSSVSFTVVATDNGPNPLSSEAVIRLLVQDYNDNPPIFSRDIYITNVPEDTEIGTAVIELSLHDDDFDSSALDFFIISNDDGGRFLVHASGQVYVARPLDREEREHYTLIVTATDGKFSANTTVSVNVIDVNDNGPECKETTYKRSVPEDAPVGSHVVSISVYDPDEGANSRSRFLLSGEGAADFGVDQQSGKIVVSRRLDRETRDSYNLVVRVEDWEEADWGCESSLTINLGDVNDNPPRFLHESFTVFASEDAPVNSVLTKVLASDSDLGLNGRLRYSLTDSAENHFAIDPSEGIVTLSRPLDRELRDTYSVVVEARDMGKPSFSSSAVLTVTVTDINDNPPEFVRTLQQVTVEENSPVGTEISRVMATSKDIGVNAEISYSLEHTTEREYLSIHPKTGVISINSILDYEEVELVVATVIAVDGGAPPLSATALINVTVTDVNDNGPVFTRTQYETTVPEDQEIGRSLIQVSANDPDKGKNGEVSFAITAGNQDQRFAVEANSGVISLIDYLDREKVSEYILEVTGRDKGTPQNSAAATVRIMVGDVNDNAPNFVETNYTAVVQENRPVGYKVFGFLVTDADSDSNGHPFTWELLGKSPLVSSLADMPFSLDQDGTLRLATNKLDHRVKQSYEVAVRVWDSGSPPLSADTVLHVSIVEESRYPPILFPLKAYVVSYLAPFSGGIIGKITASDQDPYDVLHYSIITERESDSPDYFDVDSQDGTIVALTPLDAGNYIINLSVSDGKYRRSTTASVNVFIIDDRMVDNSVIVIIGPITSEDFLSRSKKNFIASLADVTGTNEKSVKVLSLQRTILNSNMNYGNHSRDTRDIHDFHRSLAVLIAVEGKNESYLPRESLKNILASKSAKIKSMLNLSLFRVMESVCSSAVNCSKQGSCIDVIEINEEMPTLLGTQTESFIAHSFEQTTGCLCDQGFDGVYCEKMVNACGRRPCFEYEECIPSTTLSRGYSCSCPSGKGGPRCRIDLSKCQEPLCHYPIRPLSFKGKSYAQYSTRRTLESSSMQLSTYVRTKNPAGIIFFASGDVDYSILEVSGGYVQYRWDCGSGEGLVRVPNMRVDDDKWHYINVTREGTVTRLMVDAHISSGASPGVHDILNMDSGQMFIGAKVSSYNGATNSLIEFGFVGCLDLISLDGSTLPVDVSSISPSGKIYLKRLANVELSCPETLPLPGICGSHPCLNGGTCIEQDNKYSCLCLPRFTGKHCQIDTAPCSSSPCLNGGVCEVVGHSYNCKCPMKKQSGKRLSGKRCEYGVHCYPNPCENGGRCEEGVQGPICKCQHFTGTRCEMDIDECTRSPCRNGGTCLNLYGTFRCLCASNFTGDYCTEPIQKNNSSSNFFLTFKELICVLAILVACIIIIFVIVAWQRRRWRCKRHQQNNRVKLMSHHVKNDLKANDVVPKRNSKICNVEADQLQQQGPLVPRPSSYTPSGTADSVILNTLKQISACEQDTFELNTLTRRRSNEYVHNLSKPSAVVAPMTSSPSAKETRLKRKPWDHHNNLNETYFTPSKDVGLDLPPNLEDNSRGSSPQGLNLSFSDNSPVPNRRNERVYQWDDYDLRGSNSVLTTFASPAGVMGPKDISRRNSSAKVCEEPEGIPLIEPSIGASVSPSTPLLTRHNGVAADGRRTSLGDEGISAPCSFDDVLVQNNISAVETDINGPLPPTPPPPTRFNIENEEKISNIPPPLPPSLPPSSSSSSSSSSLSGSSRGSSEGRVGELGEQKERLLGSPRSRKPFVRSDFGRASDVSFLSTLEEEEKNESESYL